MGRSPAVAPPRRIQLGMRVRLTLRKAPLILRGRVVPGMGNFAFWIAHKLHDFYLGKTGMALFPGTLNVSSG